MPHSIVIAFVEDGKLDFDDAVPLIRTACTSRRLIEGTEFKIKNTVNRSDTEVLLSSLEAENRPQVIVILDMLIEKENDLLDTYLSTLLRGPTVSELRRKWPIIVFSRFAEEVQRRPHDERFFLINKLPRRGRDPWGEFRKSLSASLEIVMSMEVK